MTQADFVVDRMGSIVGVTPMNQAAREWIDENCQTEGWQWLGDTLNMDIRMAPAVVQGIADDGFTVEV